MAVTRALPPFAAPNDMSDQVSVRREHLLEATRARSIKVWEDTDAIALEYCDGHDDFWISENQMARAQGSPQLWAEELLEEYRGIDRKRLRFLRATRHALAAAGAYVDRTRTGFWQVAIRSMSFTFEVGSTLTETILRAGEAEALRQALGSLHLWPHDRVKALLQTGPEGAGWPDTALRMGASLEGKSLQQISWLNLTYLLHSSSQPQGELTWKDYEALDGDCRRPPPTLEWADGPKLPELTDKLIARLEIFADSTFEQYHRQAEKDRYTVHIEWPWLLAEDDWTTVDWHLKLAERTVAERAAADDPIDYAVIAARTFLVRNGHTEHRPALLRDLDRWWDAGAHDLQDWPELVTLFPRHPAGTEVRDSEGQYPPTEALESELPPRRYFRELLLDGLQSVSAAPSDDQRLEALDDLCSLLQRLEPSWCQRLLHAHESELEEVRASLVKLFELPGSRLTLWFDDLVAGAGHLQWRDAAVAATRHPDLSGMFFWNLTSFQRVNLRRELSITIRKIENELPLAEVDRTHEGFLFAGKPLLVLSHLCPDDSLAQLAAAALVLCLCRPCVFDDQLAAAIAWRRCRPRCSPTRSQGGTPE